MDFQIPPAAATYGITDELLKQIGMTADQCNLMDAEALILRVDQTGILDEQNMLAFLLCTHKRLGKNCQIWMQQLSPELLRKICMTLKSTTLEKTVVAEAAVEQEIQERVDALPSQIPCPPAPPRNNTVRPAGPPRGNSVRLFVNLH